ncbi:MAG: pitrilysin family protein [Bacteroidota bacterium]|nr:pitrilysin family protein [Bacteroidota bacterium]
MMKTYPLAILLTLTTAVAQQLRLAVPYSHFTLPNGLHVIVHEDHSLPLVAVNLYYHVGSAREKEGRTGLAHLFEHLMFEGSKNVPEGKFDEWLEAAGGDNNGSTSQDRTNYWITVPRNAVELALFLESDRMGFFLDAISPEKVDGQRSVVMNELRQSYENRPYGKALLKLAEYLFPTGHPYHWPVIGSMADLAAARYEDAVEFFRTYYVPNNASLVIAGDIETDTAWAMAKKWFGTIPEGKPLTPPAPPPAFLAEEKRVVLEDKVPLPRLYLVWHTPPSFAPGDAEMETAAQILAGGKSSRLYRVLVYDRQIAQDVSAEQSSHALGSYFLITATARPRHSLVELEEAIQEEIDRLKKEGPTSREMQRVVNRFEAAFLSRLERVGGFGGKADLLNDYFVRTGNPDYFHEDLARFHVLDPVDVRAEVRRFLRDDARLVMSVVPEGKTELAARKSEGGTR